MPLVAPREQWRRILAQGQSCASVSLLPTRLLMDPSMEETLA